MANATQIGIRVKSPAFKGSGRMRVFACNSDSMQPAINPGELVSVDTSVTTFKGDGVYLIDMGNSPQIKRLVECGGIFVSCDNDSYGKPFPVPPGTVIHGMVCSRQRIDRFN